jgi:hypothetical protein
MAIYNDVVQDDDGRTLQKPMIEEYVAQTHSRLFESSVTGREREGSPNENRSNGVDRFFEVFLFFFGVINFKLIRMTSYLYVD